MFFRAIVTFSHWLVSIKNSFFESIYFKCALIIKSPRDLLIPIKMIADGNPYVGRRLVDGYYVFGGVELDSGPEHPWFIETPSREVEFSLHGFSWLNDLASVGTTKSKKIAVELITKWENIYSNGKKFSWDPEITALRTLNLIINWDFFGKYLGRNQNRCLITLNRQYFFLKLIANHIPLGFTKIKVMYSILILSISYDESVRFKNKVANKLCRVISSHVDSKVFLVSRNPEELSKCFFIINELLAKNKEKAILLSKSNLKIMRDLTVSIAPILRGLRLGDGFLTRTHGGDMGSLELITKYLNLANVKGKAAIKNLMGFERVTAGRLVLIVDCGKPIFNNRKISYHGSCLGFELTSGQRPIFVNCGPGARFGTDFKKYCRDTYAHNSCILENFSQLEYRLISRESRWPEEITVGGPKNVTVDRQKTLEATWLELSNDAFEEDYGYMHFRKLFMLNTGKVFKGTDCFEITRPKIIDKTRVKNFYAFFQLHPDVELWDHPRLQTIILRLKNGEHWIFEVDLGEVKVEDSVFIDTKKARLAKTNRIVIKSPDLYNKAEIKWSLRRREIVTRNTRDTELVV